MKKLLPVIVLALYLVPLYPVYAQTRSASPSARPVLGGEERVQARIDEKKMVFADKMEERRANIASKSAALKERLLKFKDKTKADKVIKVNDNLESINSRRTEAMTNHVNTLSDIVSRLSERVETAKSAGKDTQDAEEAIADATSAISAANAAISAQGESEYTVSVSSESAAKKEITETRNRLFEDLKGVHGLIKEARDLTKEAIRTAMAIGKAQDGQ